MKILKIIISFLPLWGSGGLFAQEDTTAKSWEFTAGINTNLSHTLLINPKPSSGKPGFSTTDGFDLSANYVKEGSKFQMTNTLNWQFSLYQADLGKSPVQKATDEMNTFHDFSRGFTDKNKWNVNLILKTTTSIFTIFDGDFLSDVNNKGQIQKFLNPYEVIFSPGIKYQPNKYLKISLSPYSIRFYGTPDQQIADTGLYIQDMKDATHFKTFVSERQGAEMNIWYIRKIKKWLDMNYKLGISSNYFENLLKNGTANGLFITKIKLIGNIYLMHRAILKANFADAPFKPFYSQTVTLSYSVKF